MKPASTYSVLYYVRWAAVALILLLSVFLIGRIVMHPRGHSANAAAIGGPFSLLDQNGKTITQDDFKGKAMLVYFGYSYCPDVCPYTLQLMASALDMPGVKKDLFTPIFISIDPARDTPQELARYVKSASFPDGLVGLTGSAENIASIAKAYGVYFKKVGNGDGYLMDHTSVIYLMDENGRYVALFTHTNSADDIAKCLRRFGQGKQC